MEPVDTKGCDLLDIAVWRKSELNRDTSAAEMKGWENECDPETAGEAALIGGLLFNVAAHKGTKIQFTGR